MAGFSRVHPRTLAELLPHLDAPGFEFGRFLTGPGVFPHYVHSPIASELIACLYAAGWILEGFDWMSWQHTVEAQSLLTHRAVLARATRDEVAQVLTTLVRADRFSDGTLAEAFNSGVLVAALRRAAALEE